MGSRSGDRCTNVCHFCPRFGTLLLRSADCGSIFKRCVSKPTTGASRPTTERERRSIYLGVGEADEAVCTPLCIILRRGEAAGLHSALSGTVCASLLQPSDGRRRSCCCRGASARAIRGSARTRTQPCRPVFDTYTHYFVPEGGWRVPSATLKPTNVIVRSNNY